MKKSHVIGGLALVLACGSVASAQIFGDNFNRTGGPLAAPWTVLSGTWAISANQGTHTDTGVNQIIRHSIASVPYTASALARCVWHRHTNCSRA